MKKSLIAILVLLTAIVPIVYVIFEGIDSVNKLSNNNIVSLVGKSFSEPIPISTKEFRPAFHLQGKTEARTKKISNHQCSSPIILVTIEQEIGVGDQLFACGNENVVSSFSGKITDVVREGNTINFVYDDYSNLVLVVSADKDNLETHLRDYTNEEYSLTYLSFTKRLTDNNQVDVIYGISTIDSERVLFTNEPLDLFFVSPDTVGIQKVVNKVAVFMKNDHYYIRGVSEDGDVLGDIEIELLFEDFGTYAIEFVDGSGVEYFDLEYGIFQNAQAADPS